MSNSEVTTIQLRKSVVRALKEIKKYSRETYDETIWELIELKRSIEGKDQYDKFIHEIQKSKMKELWDNED
jgi:hypothetical protein